LSSDVKLVKLLAVCTNEERLFLTVETQHENQQAAMFVDEDCVDDMMNSKHKARTHKCTDCQDPLNKFGAPPTS